MDHFKTSAEKAAQWGVTQKTIQNLCRQEKIIGAVRRAGAWFIPDDAPNPLKNTKANVNAFQFVGTKKKIFDNAIELFMKNGYENVTVKNIADAIGIRQSAVYNHFLSKQRILDTIYDFYAYYFMVDRPDIAAIEPVLQNGSPVEIIKSMRYEFENGYIRQQMIKISVLVFERQGIDDRARNLIKTLMISDGIRFTEDVLNRAVEIGRLAPFDTHTVSVLINIVRIYTLHIFMVDPSTESISGMLKDEQALYELAACHLPDLRARTK